jgi:hypothetical protein
MLRRTRSSGTRAAGLSAAAAALLTGGVVFACSDATAPDASGTFFGPVSAMADGSGRAYVVLDRAGAPTELGVALAEGALGGLPGAHAEYVFALPRQASATAFQHAVVDWEPTGHGPAPYLVPHFDVHFYMITPEQREAITPADAQYAAKLARQPAPAFVPAGYAVGMGSARMGLHWRDPSAPELAPGGPAFTKTFIYGSYDGAVTFAEPMIAKAYLETRPAAAATTIKLPARYATTGYHATAYTVGYDAAAREYRVALTGLVKR